MAGSVRLGEIGHRVGGPALGKAADDHLGQARADDEAVLGQAFSRSKQVAPGQATMVGMGHVQHGDGPGGARGAAAHQHLDKGQGLALGVQEHVRGRRRRGLFPAVIGADLAGLGVVVDQKGPPAEAGTLRLHQPQHRLDRYGGVHRRAAGPQHLQPGLHRQGMGGGHHDLALRRRGGPHWSAVALGPLGQGCAGRGQQQQGRGHDLGEAGEGCRHGQGHGVPETDLDHGGTLAVTAWTTTVWLCHPAFREAPP